MQNSYAISVASSCLKRLVLTLQFAELSLWLLPLEENRNNALSLLVNCGYYSCTLSCWCQNMGIEISRTVGCIKTRLLKLLKLTKQTKCGSKGIWTDLPPHIPTILGPENCPSCIDCLQARIWLSIGSSLVVWMMMLIITASGSTCLISRKLSRPSINCIWM